MPPDRSSLPRAPLEPFGGPLDLLVDEVRRQNVAIEDIALAPMVARFLEYVRTAASSSLNLDIQWLHMAATLIHWKSRSLLPAEAAGQARPDAIRDGLVEQLMAHCKPAAEELARRQAIEETRFSRAAEGNVRAEPSATAELESPPVLSVWDLIQQARDIAGWVEEHRKHRHQWRQAVAVPKDPVTVAGMSEYLRSRLAASEDGRLDVSRLLKDQPTAEHRSCLFLGMLQMAQDRQVEIEQGEVFGPIWLAPGV